MTKINLLLALEAAGGGALKHVTYLATNLKPSRFNITVILSNETYATETFQTVSFLRRNGIKVNYFPMKKGISFSDITLIFKIYHYLKNNKIDLIHAHSSKAGAIFRIAASYHKIPIIYTPHCFYFMAHKGLKRIFYMEIEKLLSYKTHYIILSSVEGQSIDIRKVVPENKLIIIDNAIKPDEYNFYCSAAMRQKWNIPDNHFVIIGIGRLARQKNWGLFVEIAEKVLQSSIKNITFMIAGEGPCYNYLEEAITMRGISQHVRLINYVEDISEIYSLADIFISTTKWEGLPYTYLEASLFQIPMFITETIGIHTFCQSNNCKIIYQNDSQAFSDKILEHLKNEKKKNNLFKIDKSSFPHFIEKHQRLYNKVFDDNSNSNIINK